MNNSFAVAHVVLLEMIRRKDVYVLLFLTVLITITLGSINLFGDERIARYLKEVCLTLIWLSSIIIAVTSAARQLPAEKESRTIFPLLAKPITRWEVLVGKFLGCWAATALALAAFYLFFCVISGTREHHWPLVNYFQAWWLHVVFCGVVIALTLLGSVLFSAVAANVTIVVSAVVGILLLGRHLHKVAVSAGGVAGGFLDLLYFAIPHLEWYDVRDLIIHNWPPVGWGVVAFDTLYGACDGGLFLLLAWARFRRLALN